MPATPTKVLSLALFGVIAKPMSVTVTTRPGIPGLVCFGVSRTFARNLKEKCLSWSRLLGWRLPAVRIMITITPTLVQADSVELAVAAALHQHFTQKKLGTNATHFIGSVDVIGTVSCPAVVAATYLSWFPPNPDKTTHIFGPSALQPFQIPLRSYTPVTTITAWKAN